MTILYTLKIVKSVIIEVFSEKKKKHDLEH